MSSATNNLLADLTALVRELQWTDNGCCRICKKSGSHYESCQIGRALATLPPRPTSEQQAAIAAAIFDNDYTEMNRLKAEGKWITEAKP